MTTTLLRLEALSTARGRAPVSRNVTLDVGEGETVGLIGPVGVGKTTLLRTIMGLEPAASGRVILFGVDATDHPPERRARSGLGWCPEGSRVFPGLSVRDNLRVASFQTKRERESDVERMFDLFPILAAHAERAAWTLSGGQRQALAIGRALMGRPRLLLLDEPSLGLAPAIANELAESLRRAALGGIAALVAEATRDRAAAVVDRSLRLDADGVHPVQGALRLDFPRPMRQNGT